MTGPTTLQRAFELADTGRIRTVDDIAKALKGEAFADVDLCLADLGNRRDLRQAMLNVRGKRAS